MTTPSFGLTLSSEEHGPSELVRLGRRAEELGFDYCSVSDHFHPWVSRQGHSPFVWSVLGALAASTERIGLFTGVTCPTVRIHPAIVAHAAATTAVMAEGRFTFGVGTGEALNEHVLGDRWPRPEIRREMLLEAIEIMRAMWSGDTYDHRGEHYEVENARLFDVPDEPPPIVVSGFGEVAVRMAAEVGDGFIGHGSDRDAVRIYRESAGTGPAYAQLTFCYGHDARQAAETAAAWWPNRAIPGQLPQDLPTWTHFEQAAELVDVDTAVDGLVHGPDTDAIVREVREYLDAGYDHVHFHQIGPDQDVFLDAWEREIRDQLTAVLV